MNTKSWCFQDLPFKIDLYICPTHFKILFTCPGRTTEIKFTALFIRVALYRKWNKGHKADWITNCCFVIFRIFELDKYMKLFRSNLWQAGQIIFSKHFTKLKVTNIDINNSAWELHPYFKTVLICTWKWSCILLHILIYIL